MEEILDTGERIKARAKEMFMQYGLRSVSMDDIAGSLGLSKKTLYRFYEDKDALVGSVIREMLMHNQDCCSADKERADNAVHEIFLAMDFMHEIFRSMNPALVFDMQKYHPAAFAKFAKHKNDFLFNVIRENIQRGISEELYRPEIMVDVVARFRTESMMLPFNPEFLSKLKQSLAEVEDELMLYFLYGLVTPKGYKLAEKYRQQREKMKQ